MDQPETQLPPSQPGASDFKPNIYPVMLWALVYGATAGVLLFLLTVASQFITLVWFPVFLAGLVWGGWRNWRRQKQAWLAAAGQSYQPSSTAIEFREAVRDIRKASRDLFASEESQPEPELEELPPEEEPPQAPPPAQPPLQ